jgi:hypothetical protein
MKSSSSAAGSQICEIMEGSPTACDGEFHLIPQFLPVNFRAKMAKITEYP